MTLKNDAWTAWKALRSGPAGRRESLADIAGQRHGDPGIDAVVDAAATWLLRAQERSLSGDGGVASHYSLKDGWASSYPETTGYIIPTLLEVAARTQRTECRAAALRMLEWLESIQFDDGSFQGGNIDAAPRLPVVFNTGQILFGLAAGVVSWGEAHRRPMQAAADWLLEAQDSDGAWRKHRSPFTTAGPKAYETHVAWALLDADRASPGRGYGAGAMRNIRWAVSRQADNGWFEDCGLGDNETPITHTIGYALRGIIEGWRYSGEQALLSAACKSADAIADLVDTRGRLPGKLDRHWNPAANWICVTGSAQLAHCYFLLYRETGTARYLETGRRLNAQVRSTVRVTGDPDIAGGVKGSFPVFGGYGPFRFLNWAAKFTIDANLAERDLQSAAHPTEGRQPSMACDGKTGAHGPVA